jgi:hypothetical protein
MKMEQQKREERKIRIDEAYHLFKERKNSEAATLRKI